MWLHWQSSVWFDKKPKSFYPHASQIYIYLYINIYFLSMLSPKYINNAFRYINNRFKYKNYLGTRTSYTLTSSSPQKKIFTSSDFSLKNGTTFFYKKDFNKFREKKMFSKLIKGGHLLEFHFNILEFLTEKFPEKLKFSALFQLTKSRPPEVPPSPFPTHSVFFMPSSPPKQKIGIFFNIFFFKVFKFTWKIRNRLNRTKNQISDFYNFYCSSFGHFDDVITPISDEFSW